MAREGDTCVCHQEHKKDSKALADAEKRLKDSGLNVKLNLDDKGHLTVSGNVSGIFDANGNQIGGQGGFPEQYNQIAVSFGKLRELVNAEIATSKDREEVLSQLGDFARHVAATCPSLGQLLSRIGMATKMSGSEIRNVIE